MGLSLDALGTGQVSSHLMVNPSGIQLDMINTIAGYEDTSPDWIWESAGQRQRLRVRRRDPPAPADASASRAARRSNMGILFWRRVSRTGVSVAWPALEPGKWVFEKHAKLAFTDLQAGRRAS